MLQVKGWKNIYSGKYKYQKAAMATLISDKVNLKTKTTTRDFERNVL